MSIPILKAQPQYARITTHLDHLKNLEVIMDMEPVCKSQMHYYTFQNYFKNAFRWHAYISKQPVSKLTLYQWLTLIGIHSILGLSSVSIKRIKGKKPGELAVPLGEMRPSPPTHDYVVKTDPHLCYQASHKPMGSRLLEESIILSRNFLHSLAFSSTFPYC